MCYLAWDFWPKLVVLLALYFCFMWDKVYKVIIWPLACSWPKVGLCRPLLNFVRPYIYVQVGQCLSFPSFYFVFLRQKALFVVLVRPAKLIQRSSLLLVVLANFFHNWWYKVVSSLFCYVLQVLNLCLRLADF